MRSTQQQVVTYALRLGPILLLDRMDLPPVLGRALSRAGAGRKPGLEPRVPHRRRRDIVARHPALSDGYAMKPTLSFGLANYGSTFPPGEWPRFARRRGLLPTPA